MSILLWLVLIVVVVMYIAPMFHAYQMRKLVGSGGVDPEAMRHITTRTIFALLAIEYIRRM